MTDRVVLKVKDIPAAKAYLIKVQKFCPLCGIDLRKLEPKDVCLDHHHKLGYIRDLLCRNCNGIEGRILRFVGRAKRGGTEEDWLLKMMEYWKRHLDNPSDIFHHTFRDEDQKRILRNKRAKKRRQALKSKKL